MTNEEFQYIKLTFQLHLANIEGDVNKASLISEEMELIERKAGIGVGFNGEATIDIGQMNNIGCYCYALTISDEKLKNRYKELLFADTNDSDELDEIFRKSYVE